MESEILSRPAFAHLKVRLKPGETITAESGAMASMRPEKPPMVNRNKKASANSMGGS